MDFPGTGLADLGFACAVVVNHFQVEEGVGCLGRSASGHTQHFSSLVGGGCHHHFVVDGLDTHQGTSLEILGQYLVDQVAHQECLAYTTGATKIDFLLVVEQEGEEAVSSRLLLGVQWKFDCLVHAILQKKPPVTGVFLFSPEQAWEGI